MDDAPAEIDCLVVGAGPAGLTAALYLRRFHRHIRLVDAGASRARLIDRSHNYPGFPEGIAGTALLQRLRHQLAAVDGEVETGDVQRLERHPAGGFAVQLDAQRCHARTVLLATGVVDAVPALPGIEAVQRRGRLRQCPICDGHEFRDCRIAVLGDGPHAEREAAFIAHYSARVLLQGLGEPPAAAATRLPDGVRRSAAAVMAVAQQADGTVELHLRDGRCETVDVLYAALGSRPRSALAQGLGARLDARGAVLTDAHGASSVDGLYAAGDVVSALDQLAVAVGHGAITATAIHNRLAQAAAGTPPAASAAAARVGRSGRAEETP